MPLPGPLLIVPRPSVPDGTDRVGADEAEEWLIRYAEELGHLPGSAEQLRAFALNRGDRLPYSTARRAVTEQAVRQASSTRVGASSAPVPVLETQSVRSQQIPGRVLVTHRFEGTSRIGEEAPSGAVASLLAMYENVRGGVGLDETGTASWDTEFAVDLPRDMLEARAPSLADRISMLAGRRRRAAFSGRTFPTNGERLIMWEAARQDLQAFLESADTRQLSERIDVTGGKALLRTFPLVKPEFGSVCAICIDEADTDCEELWRRVPCGHVYHESCLAELVQLPHRRSCPLCRLDLADVARSFVGTRLGTSRTEPEEPGTSGEEQQGSAERGVQEWSPLGTTVSPG